LSLFCSNYRKKKTKIVFILIYTSIIFILFCFSGSDSGELCECGLEKSEHKPYLEDSAEEWHMPANTFERINPAHGRLPNKAWV